MFSPSVFSPSVFSPSVFSPSVFSPSVFSPSVFSPSVFSPSVFSPSVFSPSVFSPSVFSPSVFSPSVFSDGQAYESAQVRSLLAVSANDGTAGEHLSVDTWNNTGEFYVRVAGRNGAHSPGAPFDLAVHLDPSSCTGVAPSTLRWRRRRPLRQPGADDPDHRRLRADDRQPHHDAGPAGDARRAPVNGQDRQRRRPARASPPSTSRPTGTPAARTPRTSSPRPSATSSLGYRNANATVDYVVIVGPDDVIPFFRYPDASGLGPESGYVPPVLDTSASQASLRLNYYLSQDAYGATTELQLKGITLPVPDLPVGRLVETPAEITGMLDAFLGLPAVLPKATSSLVTGYDFLTDGANAVQRVAQRRRRGSRRRLADHQPGCRPDQRGTAARAVVERRPAAHRAARRAPRHRVPRGALQRQQPAGRRLRDDHERQRADGVERRPHQLRGVQRRLPLGVHRRRWRRRAQRDADPGLDPSVRPEAGHGRRRHRLPIRRHRFPGVQRAAVQEPRRGVPLRHRSGQRRWRPRLGQAALPHRHAVARGHPPEGPPRGHHLRPPDVEGRPAERSQLRAPGRGADRRGDESRADRARHPGSARPALRRRDAHAGADARLPAARRRQRCPDRHRQLVHRAERRRDQPRRAGPAARGQRRHGRRPRAARGGVPLWHLHRYTRDHAPHRCPGDRAQQPALAIRLLGLLPEPPVERQLLRRAAEPGRDHEADADARAVPERRAGVDDQRAAEVHRAPVSGCSTASTRRPSAPTRPPSPRRRRSSVSTPTSPATTSTSASASSASRQPACRRCG